MPHIEVLPKQLADMIAAGEVVERPASVVKELTENAIDAGATEITVEIRHGGASYIRVTDNGCGIPKDEVPTAFLRHATSKLKTAQDLESIGTLGFRGEALAAISAVSYVQILTKPRDQEMGYSYAIENSEPLEEGDAGCPDGTTIVVRDVFFSVPARYKYLKTDAAEGTAIHAVIQRQALAHPEVSFRFVKDGKRVFSTAGDGRLLNVIEMVLPGESAQMLEVKATDGPITVTGYVGRPTRCKGSRSGQYTFVNGRWIHSKLLTAAIEQAYQNQHMVGRFPIAVLHIGMDLDKVDVNAHPTKTEVRFVEEKTLFGRVYHAVAGALAGAVDRPDLATAPVAPPSAHATSAQTTVTFQSPKATAEPCKPRSATWPRQEWTAQPKAARTSPLPPLPQEARPAAAPVQSEPEQLKMPAPPIEPARPQPFAISSVQPKQAEQTTDAPPQGQPAAQPEKVPWRVIGEAMKTYIIVEQGDQLLFIDKHAAHERMGFDKLKAQDYRPMMQELLKPLAFQAGAEEREILLAHADELEEFGFQLEALDDAIAVRSAPDFLAYEDIAATLEELAGKYALGTADPKAQRDELMHTMACKAAVKGGQKNGPEELLAIAKAVMAGEVTHCPHGRPVAAQLTRKQLEKQFGRS